MGSFEGIGSAWNLPSCNNFFKTRGRRCDDGSYVVQVKNWELVLKITFMKSMNLHLLKHGTGFLLMTFDSPEAATAASDCFFIFFIHFGQWGEEKVTLHHHTRYCNV